MGSLKKYSYITNILVFIAGFVSYLGADGLSNIIPGEYEQLIPFIVMLAGYFLVQSSENKRVEKAKEIATKKTLDNVSTVKN